MITSADCGAGRHVSIACPAECAFNPFAPAAYDQVLELVTKPDRAALALAGRPRVQTKQRRACAPARPPACARPLIEVREIRADGLLSCTDWLEPAAGESIVIDHAAWAHASRIRILLV